MFFKQWYNWLKYHTLPTSYLFKNRLFIEREGRFKRITSNLGLVFRNTKWTNYELPNIQLKFRWNYIVYSFFSFFILLLLLMVGRAHHIYFGEFVWNLSNEYIWWMRDSVFYYSSIMLWSLWIGLSNLVKWLMTFVLRRVVVPTERAELPPATMHPTTLSAQLASVAGLSGGTTTAPTLPIDKLFGTAVDEQNSSQWNNWFVYLYRTAYWQQYWLEAATSNWFYTNYMQVRGPNMELFNLPTTTPLTSNLVGAVLWRLTTKQVADRLEHNNPLVLGRQVQWNLISINAELAHTPAFVYWCRGLVYIARLDFNKLNYFNLHLVELFNIPELLSNQFNLIKQYRWLYRYSLLHRNLLTNTINITHTKRLLNSGFYTIGLFNRNLWAAETLATHQLPETIFSLYRELLYNNLFNSINGGTGGGAGLFNMTFQPRDYLNLFAHYENSYIWFLKRFYLFSTLANNETALVIQPMQSSLLATQQFFNRRRVGFDVGRAYLLNSSLLTNPLAIIAHPTTPTNAFLTKFRAHSHQYFTSKDLFLLFGGNNMLTKARLDILYWLTLNPFSGSYRLGFYNYLVYVIPQLKGRSRLLVNTKNTPQFFHIVMPSNQQYLMDLSYFLYL